MTDHLDPVPQGLCALEDWYSESDDCTRCADGLHGRNVRVDRRELGAKARVRYADGVVQAALAPVDAPAARLSELAVDIIDGESD